MNSEEKTDSQVSVDNPVLNRILADVAKDVDSTEGWHTDATK